MGDTEAELDVERLSAAREKLPRREVSDAMRPARGIAVGLTLSVIIWLVLLVAYLAS